jgi:gluconate kinase
MKPSGEPDLELRSKLVRSLGLFREMLAGSFVERQRACGRPTCHCADGKRLHPQFQISLLVDGKPKTFNIPAQWVETVRNKVEMRRRFEAAAATICSVNLKRFLQEKLHEKKKKLREKQEKEDRQI